MSIHCLAQSVVINEFMAENDTLTMITDEAYQYDDWIELFNRTNSPIDLSGYFMSDKANELDKWAIPSGTILPANGYLVVWADNDESQGVLHANFKLSKDGEFIALSNPSLTVLDSISFGPQEKNVAMARIPNGTGDFVERAPTFATDNEGTLSVFTPFSKTALFELYPNPAANQVELVLLADATIQDNVQLKISNINGQILYTKTDHFFQQKERHTIDIASFPPGVYFIHLKDAKTQYVQKLIIQ